MCQNDHLLTLKELSVVGEALKSCGTCSVYTGKWQAWHAVCPQVGGITTVWVADTYASKKVVSCHASAV